VVNRRSTSRPASRSGSTARRRTGTTRRRTTPGYRTRRRTPSTPATLGSAFALGLVALFVRAGWPVRIGVVVVALVAVAAFLVIRARSAGAPDAEPAAEPAAEPPVDPGAATAAPSAPSDPKEPTP